MLPDGYHALVILPAKFRKQIWIRKGGFVIVQVTRDEEDEEGQRSFNGEIVRVLLKDDEKHLRALEGGTHWPERWCITDGDGDGDGYGDDRDNRDDRDDNEDRDDRDDNEDRDDRDDRDDNEDRDGDEDQGERDGHETTTGAGKGIPDTDSSEDELPEHLQRVSNRRRVQYRDDSSSDSD